MHISSRATGMIGGQAFYGDRAAHQTVEVNFAPRAASASVAISAVWISGDGFPAIGIRSFEYRDSPSGPNKKKDFTRTAQPPTAYHKLMTRVTFHIQVIPDSFCLGSWTLDFWS